MATLVSPGTSVTVIDESMYASAGPGTVPLFFIATQENKNTPDGEAIAAGTTTANADKMLTITSQRDALETFGNPFFESNDGTVIQGSEMNEWGLWALYSYLGIANRAYVIRADVATNELEGTQVAPVGDPVNGTYWFGTTNTKFGVFRNNGNTTAGLAWDRVNVKVATASDVDGSDVPNSTFGKNGDIAVVVSTTANVMYEKIQGSWYKIGTAAWQAEFDTVLTGEAAPVYADIANGDGFDITTPDGTDTVTFSGTESTLSDVTTAISGAITNTNVTVSDDGTNVVLTEPGGQYITLENAVGSGIEDVFGFTGPYTEPGVDLAYAKHTSIPSGKAKNSIWIKTTTPNNGADWIVEKYSVDTGQWTEFDAPLYAGHVEAESAIGDALGVGSLFVEYDVARAEYEATHSIRRYTTTDAVTVTGSVDLDATPPTGAEDIDVIVPENDVTTYTVSFTGSETGVDDVISAFEAAGIPDLEFTKNDSGNLVVTDPNGNAFRFEDNSGTPIVTLGLDASATVVEFSNWSTLTYEASDVAPSTDPEDGTMWYDDSFFADIMVADGDEWAGLQSAKGSAVLGTSTLEVQLTSATPSTKSDGSTSLEDGDLWIDTADTENYPALYRWNSGSWEAVDKTDQTTPFGIVFADARASDETGNTDEASLLASDFVDPDAPNPRTYAAGTLLFNTRRSTYNVKEWRSDALADYADTYDVGANTGLTKVEVYTGSGDDARWVSISGLKFDSSPYMGRKAQRNVIVQALQGSIASNEDARSEWVNFNLITTPGYVECLDEMKTLNVDRKETAFIVSDTPARLAPNGTAINNWCNNTEAASPGEEGRTASARYTYASMVYPWGLGTNVDGENVVVPGSALKMRTIAFNDQVAYPWFPAAGARRGLVTNAASTGYITDEGEYQATFLREGIRDVLYEQEINPITPIPGVGLSVWGQKTLQAFSSALDRENVARLVVYLRYQLDVLSKPYIFQLNNEKTRANIRTDAERLLQDVQSKDGIYDFVVRCDSTNNTPARIDRNELWMDILVEPAKAVEFIQIPVRIQNTGAI